jgi:hypothetical protein
MQEHSLLTVHLHMQLAVPSGYNLSTHNSNLHAEKKFPLCEVNLHMLLKFMSVKVMLVFCPRIIVLSWESLHFALRQLAENWHITT